MKLCEVKMIQTLVAYHDGFTRSVYPEGTTQTFEAEFAKKWELEGFCTPIVVDIETKPSPIEIETKPLTVKRRRAKQSHNSTRD